MKDDVTITISKDLALFLLWIVQNNGMHTDAVWREYHNKVKCRDKNV